MIRSRAAGLASTRHGRGAVSVEYAFLAAAIIVGIAAAGTALSNAAGGSVERVAARAAAAAQGGDGSAFSVRMGDDKRL